VDLDNILKNYETAAAVSLRRGELVKIESDAREEMQMMQKFTPGTADYKKHEDRLTEMKVKLDAGQEQAQREFTLRQAEMFATLYKEIQAMVARVAKWHKMTYVLRVSSRPPSATEQNSVIAAMMETVIFSDPQNDITNDVVHYLNYYYKATASPAPAQRPATRQPSAAEDPAAR
jgi:outer membrane protein